MENKKKIITGVIIGAIVIIGIILIWFFATGQATKEVNAPKTNVDAIVDEQGYDITEAVKEEAEKKALSKSTYEGTKYDLIRNIEAAEYKVASGKITELFETFKKETEEGLELQEYEEDLAVINLFASADRDNYTDLLKHFKKPETLLAMMVYLPPSIKKDAILSINSLVPTTEDTDLKITDIKDASEEILKNINNSYENSYVSCKIVNFSASGIDCAAYMVENKEGFIHLYEIISQDPDSYFMTVNVWETEILI